MRTLTPVNNATKVPSLNQEHLDDQIVVK